MRFFPELGRLTGHQTRKIMPWHPFQPGDERTPEEVFQVCLRRIESGKVKSAEDKREMVERIRTCGFDTIVFRPFGGGWGRSPFNASAWRTVEGGPIFETETSSTGSRKRRRRRFTKDQRRRILEKTAGRCYSCGLEMGLGDDWWVEHIIPLSKGGADDPENLLPSCRLCNWVRSNREPMEIRRILRVGKDVVREMNRGSRLGREVEAFLDRLEARRARRRKHQALAMTEARKNTIREER